MMYGLLLEGAIAEEQQNEARQAKQTAGTEEDSWCLGMEAWVNCENAQPN